MTTPRSKQRDTDTGTGTDKDTDTGTDTKTDTDTDTDTDKDKDTETDTDGGETSVYPGRVFAPELELVQSPWPEARYLKSHARLGLR